MGAIALTDGYADTKAVILTAKSFGGLAHRAEHIASINGVAYIDSSIDSTPRRTTATLNYLNRSVILLLGGKSKGLDYSELSEPILKYAKSVILYGENAEEIFSAIIDKVSRRVYIYREKTLFDSVKLAKSIARDGDTVLLSPASTSYDAFKSFEERGLKFSEYVKN